MSFFDVHAHATYPQDGTDGAAAVAALIQREGFAGSVPGGAWSAEAALRFMDGRSIRMQLLSTPGAQTAEQARTWNLRTGGLVEQYPDRFGLLAALPLGDPSRAVEEIRFAVAELDPDGFCVVSNYDGVYFGDPTLQEVFAALDEVGLPLFVHPALPPGFDRLGLGRPGPLFEYPVDTARTIIDALFAGVLQRHPRLPLILAHGGGVLPTLRDRLQTLGTQSWTRNPLQLTDQQIGSQFAGLHLDTAIASGRGSIEPALAMVGPDNLLFGTDYLPAGEDTIDRDLTQLRDALPGAEALLARNFARLFPAAATRADR